MRLNLEQLPYSSRRQPVFARRGVVASSQPLAVQAGLAMLHRGGNAVDAALATAIALTVVEPTSCGIGGDAFALVWDGQRLHGLNGSGRAPAGLDDAIVRGLGHAAVPECGWLPTTVPGAPAAWRDLHERFGSLPFAELFEPAIEYAEGGYPISPKLALKWRNVHARFRRGLSAAELASWERDFAPGGRAPAAGEIWACPDMGRTLRQIAASGSAEFYHGAIARAIGGHAASTGGWLRAEDLAAHTSTWVEPIGTSYRGYEVWEIPPNGQGLAALIALNILEGFDMASIARDSALSYHLQIEAMKLAYADAQRYIADPEHSPVPTEQLLSKEYAASRRALIGDQARPPAPGDPLKGGTVYLCAADASGMMVSFIESTYFSFGSGIAVPGTGVVLQNRGAGFSLDPAHPNVLAPGKRPYHTIIPGFLTRDGAAIGPFGVMGGHMQPQGHLQMIVNTIDYGMNPQASLDAPRWQWQAGQRVTAEAPADPAIAGDLLGRGHALESGAEDLSFGCGQIIWRLENGAYVAGSDSRADGLAIGF